jgi:hypothetical protein
MIALARTVAGAELAVLAPETWDEYVPKGKEVDCTYGDFVLRNDRLVAVVAKPVETRHANLTVHEVGGAIIDLTERYAQNDQLSAFYPGARQFPLRFQSMSATGPHRDEGPGPGLIRAESVELRLVSPGVDGQPAVQVIYALRDGEDHILVTSTYRNQTKIPLEISLVDEIRADRTFEKAPDGEASFFWVYDKWFGQAYGLLPEGHTVRSQEEGRYRASALRYLKDGEETLELRPGEEYQLVRRLFPKANLIDVKSQGRLIRGESPTPVTLDVVELGGQPVSDADVSLFHAGKAYGNARTPENGRLEFTLPRGKFRAEISALGRGTKGVTFGLEASKRNLKVGLPVAPRVVARISDEEGKPIACKVQFVGVEGTESPYFGPDSGEHAVHNLYYSHNGRFTQILPPGNYEVIISHGPEYDAVFTRLEVPPEREVPLEATMKRVVKTPGWVSADFHSHSSPSGDNTTSQLGRVLNGRPLLVNHHNAFPLVMTRHIQDGGAPLPDEDSEVQIQRLALWDDGSDKLVQQNHPDIGWLFYDKDADGQPDGGFKGMFGYMDVIEVHPLGEILTLEPTVQAEEELRNHRVFNWLQLLNQGYRIPGVVNTDSHYTFHGSGWLRNYILSPNDEPAEIQTLDIVHASERGNLIMTNGPFLEVHARAVAGGKQGRGTAGDEIRAPGGELALQVRVQCPNWFDINRVQILVNGRPDSRLNYTRIRNPGHFGNGVVKFDREIPITLKGNAHLIVVAIGENSQLGVVMGPEEGEANPVAVSNPIYVDVDGGGFKANGDTLGSPLPIKLEREEEE